MKETDRVIVRASNFGSVLSMMISLVLHLLVTLILSWIVIAHTGSGIQGVSLNGQQLDNSSDEFTSLEISSNSAQKGTEESMQSMPEALPSHSQTKLSVEMSNPSQTADLRSSAFEETSVALTMRGGSEENQAGGGSRNGKSGGSGATFFGARATGQRFVFVIDSSSSMIGPRWLALRRELVRAVESLSVDQEFFVISFDAVAHPMFNEIPPKGKFLKPTSENIERLNRWVGSIQHGSSTLPASAIGIALQLEPDAIFLLSDGEIRDATLFDLRLYNRKEDAKGEMVARIPIHTVLLDSLSGYLTLKNIADENAGDFTPVRVFRY